MSKMKSSICINIDDTTTPVTGPHAVDADRNQPCHLSSTSAAVDAELDAPPVDQLRALSLNRLDGMLRSTSVIADLPFKCPSYPRLGERQLSSSTALDEFSLSPRLSSNANLSQDLDAADLLPVMGSVAEMSARQPGVALTRSVSVRTAVCKPLTAASLHLLVPTGTAPVKQSSSRRQTELTSEQRLPFPECPAVSGGIIRRSTSCPLRVISDIDGVECRSLAAKVLVGDRESNDRRDDRHLTTEQGDARCRRRRSSAFERDVDLRGEVVADLPVALRAQFPDFEPDAPSCSVAAPPRFKVTDLRLPLPTVIPAETDASSMSAVDNRIGSGCRYNVNDLRLLIPSNTVTGRHMTIAGCFTPPAARCDVQIKCLRWLRDAERQEQQ